MVTFAGPPAGVMAAAAEPELSDAEVPAPPPPPGETPRLGSRVGPTPKLDHSSIEVPWRGSRGPRRTSRKSTHGRPGPVVFVVCNAPSDLFPPFL